MNIKVTTRRISDRKTAKQKKKYALTKIPRISKYLRHQGRDAEVSIILSSEKLRHTAEIIVMGTRLRATASVTSDDLSSSIDNVMDAVTKQLRRKSDKQISTRRRISGGEPPREKTKTPEVKIQRVAAKPMSVEEAVLRVGVSEKEFLAFINSETQEMNVAYRRNKKTVLIVP